MERFSKYFLILFCTAITVSCNNDSAKLTITDFSNSKAITLKPNEGYPYAMMNLWVEGYVDDTILIKLGSNDNVPILKLSGKIKERWYTDYYGGGPRTIIIEPYKATKGELEIEFSL